MSRIWHWCVLSIILVCTMLLRIGLLDRIPPGITGDELVYVITASSVRFFGTDLSGTWYPFSVFAFHYPPGQLQAELPYFILLPFISLLPVDLFSIRLSGALFGTITVLLMYLLGRRLFSEQVGIWAAIITALNPWMLFISRTAYEVNFSVPLYLTGMVLLLSLNRWKKLLSLIFFLFGFYAYVGTKIIMLPLLLATCIYLLYEQRNNNVPQTKYVLATAISGSIAYLILAAGIVLAPLNRTGELLTPFHPSLSGMVDMLRAGSLVLPFQSLVINKVTVFTGIIATKLFETTSPLYLFNQGDAFMDIWRSGLLYWSDAALLLIGIVLLARTQMKVGLFIFSAVLIGLAPRLLHSTMTPQFTPHISLVFPFIFLVIAYGVAQLLQHLRSYRLRIIGVVMILAVLGYQCMSFLNIYLGAYPMRAPVDMSSRLMSNYARLASMQDADQRILVMAPSTQDILLKYAFYRGYLNSKDGIDELKQGRDKSMLGNTEFISCNMRIQEENLTSILLVDARCPLTEKRGFDASIIRHSDGGALTYIMGDTVCTQSRIKAPQQMTLDDFAIERLGKDDFCNAFVRR